MRGSIRSAVELVSFVIILRFLYTAKISVISPASSQQRIVSSIQQSTFYFINSVSSVQLQSFDISNVICIFLWGGAESPEEIDSAKSAYKLEARSLLSPILTPNFHKITIHLRIACLTIFPH